MKITFSIFVAAALLLGSSSAEAARGIMLPPTSPSTSAPLIPQTNPIGGAGTGQSFGALPGAPGSPTYDPNAALPSLNNQGSALAPLAPRRQANLQGRPLAHDLNVLSDAGLALLAGATTRPPPDTLTTFCRLKVAVDEGCCFSLRFNIALSL